MCICNINGLFSSSNFSPPLPLPRPPVFSPKKMKGDILVLFSSPFNSLPIFSSKIIPIMGTTLLILGELSLIIDEIGQRHRRRGKGKGKGEGEEEEVEEEGVVEEEVVEEEGAERRERVK